MLTGLGIDEYFTRTDSSGTASFLTDALGSTLELTDNSGNSLAQYAYEPFGNTTATGTSTNPYQYTGRENDGDGLYFLRARYYSPTLQRFVSEDPLGLSGGSTNLYSYSVNDPVYFADPTGHCPMCVVAIAGGIIGGAYAGYEGYQNGARGLRLIGDISGGAGTGILVGLTGGAVGGFATDLGFGGVASGAFGGAAGGGLGGGIKGTICKATGNGGWGQVFSDSALGAVTGAFAGAAGGALQPAVQGGSNFDPFSSPRVFGPKAQQLYYNSAASTGIDVVTNADASKLGGRKDPGGCQ